MLMMALVLSRRVVLVLRLFGLLCGLVLRLCVVWMNLVLIIRIRVRLISRCVRVLLLVIIVLVLIRLFIRVMIPLILFAPFGRVLFLCW